VTVRALALLKASIQNRISVNSALGSMPMDWIRKTSFSLTVSSALTNRIAVAENAETLDFPMGMFKYSQIPRAKSWPVLPANTRMGSISSAPGAFTKDFFFIIVNHPFYVEASVKKTLLLFDLDDTLMIQEPIAARTVRGHRQDPEQ
jgi:hypothetical protein